MASDIWTELGHLVLDARHNNTARERGEAARLTLLGKPTSRSPYIPVTQEVPWERLADVAISPDGCVAACGIEANGDKQIMEWTVASRQWICRIIDSTWAEMRVANLHYPSDSEDVAYTVTVLDGKARVFWGDWNFDAAEGGEVESIFCYRDGSDQTCCIVISSHEARQVARLARRIRTGGDWVPGRKIADSDLSKILGRFGERIAILLTQEVKQSVCLVDLVGNKLWQSDWYDVVVPSSAMERNGVFSFVGWIRASDGAECHQQSPEFKCYLGKVSQPDLIHCLPSGCVLIEGYRVGEHDDRSSTTFYLRDLRDAIDGDVINLGKVQGIGSIVEVPQGLVIHKVASDNRHELMFVKEDDTDPGRSDIYTMAKTQGAISHLNCWDGYLVFQHDEEIVIVSVASDDWAYETGNWKRFPLLVDFDRLVPTDEGILWYKFEPDGTFIIIRYPLG